MSAPALASIRPELEQMLSQLAAIARFNAQGRLAEATQRLETATLKNASTNEARPEIFLLVAERLIESGGLANYVRSAAVSAALIDQRLWAPALHAESPLADKSGVDSRIPLRLLIPAWFALGIASAALCWWLHTIVG